MRYFGGAFVQQDAEERNAACIDANYQGRNEGTTLSPYYTMENMGTT